MADTLFKEKLEKVKRKKIVGNNISWKFSKIAVLKGQCQSEHFLTQNKALIGYHRNITFANIFQHLPQTFPVPPAKIPVPSTKILGPKPGKSEY